MVKSGLLIAVGILIIALTGCDESQQPPTEEQLETQREFLSNLTAFCGYAYSGQTEHFDLGNEALEDPDMLMLVEKCEEDEVRIPFWVDDDRSRTWILDIQEYGLRLSHDHRYEDGTEHDANMYGGFADERGSSTKQYFPADEATIQERPAREINVWSTELDLQDERYIYRLYLDGELRFKAAFDLSDPIDLEVVR